MCEHNMCGVLSCKTYVFLHFADTLEIISKWTADEID